MSYKKRTMSYTTSYTISHVRLARTCILTYNIVYRTYDIVYYNIYHICMNRSCLGHIITHHFFTGPVPPCLLKTAMTRIVHGIRMMKGIMVPLKQRKLPPLKVVRHCTSDIRYRMLTCDIVRAYDVVFDMNQQYRMSCTYDIICPFPTYDIVYYMWR
jgi:hypothetical protein